MHTIRVPFAVMAALLFSVAGFYGLWRLVNVPMEIGSATATGPVVFTRQRVDTVIETKRDEKVQRTPPPTVPRPTEAGIESSDIGTPTDYQPPPIGILPLERGFNGLGTDQDALPIVRVTPDYPPRAMTSGTEGWVRVRFAVSPTGAVRDPVVVASEPGTVFDDAAVKAVSRWRYNPRVENGAAVERVGLEAIIRFELER